MTDFIKRRPWWSLAALAAFVILLGGVVGAATHKDVYAEIAKTTDCGTLQRAFDGAMQREQKTARTQRWDDLDAISDRADLISVAEAAHNRMIAVGCPD